MPAIQNNFAKFDCFYREMFTRTAKKYTSDNFNNLTTEESLDGFVCGSDTIFCIDEFNGFDDGYYANYPVMKGSLFPTLQALEILILTSNHMRY